MSKIKTIHARQILDSRGNPTIETDITLENGTVGRASVPSGASTGSREALELRDGDKSLFLGKSVFKAIENVNNIIAPELIGFDSNNQELLDQTMLKLDGTDFKSNLGANSILSVSLANARCAATNLKKPLYKHISSMFKVSDFLLPAPMMNIINGGEHASNNLDIQEFMILPHMNKSFNENLRAGVETFHNLKKVLSSKNYSTNVGDEGGFAPNLKSHKEAIELILTAIEQAGYRPGEDISIALDAAASEFYRDGVYKMEGNDMSSSDMISYYESLVNDYPIHSIEDGLAEQDHSGWKEMTKVLTTKSMIVGDDLFVTNKKIFQEGIDNGEANSILIKLNQIGTLTETIETMTLARESNYKAVVSHRSGETADNFIADLTVASNCGFIKTGSASRSDRVEKYNQLLRIEEDLANDAKFAWF